MLALVAARRRRASRSSSPLHARSPPGPRWLHEAGARRSARSRSRPRCGAAAAQPPPTRSDADAARRSGPDADAHAHAAPPAAAKGVATLKLHQGRCGDGKPRSR